MRVLAGILAAASAHAHAASFDPRLELEARQFETLGLSVAGTIEARTSFDGDRQRLETELFARYDFDDAARTHADVRELYWAYLGRDLELRIGNRRVFWGVTESRHLADVVNQSDFVEDLDNEAKLGQPMLHVAWITGVGTLESFVLPYQRARTFPGTSGHPRFPFPVAADEARYESDRGQHHLDYALRWQGSYGPADVGLAWFDGTARDPDLLPCLRRGSDFEGTRERANCDIPSGISLGTSQGLPLVGILQALGLAPSDAEEEARIRQAILENLVLVPSYPLLRQASVDAQWVSGSLALKLEALWREHGGSESTAAVAGFEYTVGDVLQTGADLGLLGEYLHDTRESPFTARADHDVFAGLRVGVNDVAGTQLLGGVIVDRSGEDRTWQVEASGRLGDGWKLSVELRIFEGVPADSPAAFLDDEDQLSVVVERFF